MKLSNPKTRWTLQLQRTRGALRAPSATVALALGVALAACSGQGGADVTTIVESDEAGTLPVEEGDPAGTEEVLATVDVGYGTVGFHRLTLRDGREQVVMSETAPNNAALTPFDSLTAEGHTALELFRSIAPDREAPAELEALHAVEAAELQRPDAAVITGHFNREVSVEKSAEACDAFVYREPPPGECGQYWGNHRIATITSGSKGLHVGQEWAYATSSKVTLGICNESDVSIRGRIGVDRGGDRSSNYEYWGWATVSAGQKRRWFYFRSANECDCPDGPGFACTFNQECYVPSRYRVDGDAPAGAKYLLRTAEIEGECITL